MISGTEECSAAFLFCDIRGFSKWMADNQLEAPDLLDTYYSCAFERFGARREQKYHRRVAKLLGDGFLAVHEYDKSDLAMFADVLDHLTGAIITFTTDFLRRLEKSTMHNKKDLKCAFGLAYGRGLRITIPGFPFDYISHKINLASRLVGVAEDDEVVFERDLWDSIPEEGVFNKRKEKRELKKIGPTEVGVFDTVA